MNNIEAFSLHDKVITNMRDNESPEESDRSVDQKPIHVTFDWTMQCRKLRPSQSQPCNRY